MSSLAWSLLGFLAGFAVGTIAAKRGTNDDVKDEDTVTTPERLRRRQIRNDISIAIIVIAIAGGAFYFDRSDDRQRNCLSTYVEQSAVTSKARGAAVAAESEATRDVIRSVLEAKSPPEVQAAYARYRKALERIDERRADNPVPTFPKGVCD
jgi:hypothetical protein